jgi:hypothetical protein
LIDLILYDLKADEIHSEIILFNTTQTFELGKGNVLDGNIPTVSRFGGIGSAGEA